MALQSWSWNYYEICTFSSQGDRTFPILQYLAGCSEGLSLSLSSVSNIPIIHNIVH